MNFTLPKIESVSDPRVVAGAKYMVYFDPAYWRFDLSPSQVAQTLSGGVWFVSDAVEAGIEKDPSNHELLTHTVSVNGDGDLVLTAKNLDHIPVKFKEYFGRSGGEGKYLKKSHVLSARKKFDAANALGSSVSDRAAQISEAQEIYLGRKHSYDALRCWEACVDAVDKVVLKSIYDSQEDRVKFDNLIKDFAFEFLKLFYTEVSGAIALSNSRTVAQLITDVDARLAIIRAGHSIHKMNLNLTIAQFKQYYLGISS